MSETTVPYMRVEAPTIGRPQRGGLLDHDEFIVTVSDPHLGGGVEYRPRTDCSPVGLAPGLCSPSDLVVDAEKEWHEPGLITSPAFATYKGAGCAIIGEPYDEQARAGLELGEGSAVALAWNGLLQAGTFGPSVGLFPGTPQSVQTAVGRMEDALSLFAGDGVIVTSRTVATWMVGASVARWDGDNLVTALGTPLIAEEGFGRGPTDIADGDWLYGLINPRFYKGASIIEFGARDLATNESIRIAERLWSVSMECEILAIEVADPYPVPTP